MSIRVEFLAKSMFADCSAEEKITHILNQIRQKKIIVLEGGLTPIEQAELIKHTMMTIDYESFVGVEMISFSERKTKIFRTFKKNDPSLIVIAPSELVENLYQSATLFSIALNPKLQ
jgi:hypothetical protein